jgi:RND superfamily putative drug exporter
VSSVLYQLGRWAFRARKLVLILWIGALVLFFAGAGLLSTGTNNTFNIPGTESQEALDALARTFPQVSGTSAQLIIVAPKGSTVRQSDYQTPIEASIKTITAIPQVSSATSPYDDSTTKGNINSDSSAALVPIQLSVVQSAASDTTKDSLQSVSSKLAKQLPSGSQVAMGGQLFSQSPASISITELIGIIVAFIVLIFTFASFVAAGLPLVTALLGVGMSLAIIFAATRFAVIASTTPLLSLMLGLAVGIDYALFIISRHQDQVKQGIPPEESAARAVATAGSAVVFAAITVIIALLGLSVAQIPFLTTMGVAAALAVAMAVLISMTLTPALLGFVGMRIVAKRFRPARQSLSDRGDPDTDLDSDEFPEGVDGGQADEAESDIDTRRQAGRPVGAHVETVPQPRIGQEAGRADDSHEAPPALQRGFFLAWVRTVTKWPIVTVIAIVVLLGLATVPASHLRLALPDAGSLEEHDPARITYDLISKNFGPGYNGPLIVTGQIIQSTDPVGLMNKLGAEIAAIPGVAAVPISTPNQSGDTGIVQVIPVRGPDSPQTKALVIAIRALQGELDKKYGVKLSVTGYTAAGIDISERLAEALVPFALLVVGLSLVLLAMVFRSIVVPVTAALGYLLSVGAAFGISSLVFEGGFLAGPLNVTSLGSVISFMPIILMGVLFGLAMDYEVFLVSRMREDFVHFGDARHAVHSGFVGSARVVTAAAIIMFAVFAAFVPSGDTSIQPIALGLAVGVAIDAFIVRMSLIPAVLMLFGRKAWWIPGWLDRVLPSFDVEGEGLHKELELADWPAPGDSSAIAADGVSVTDRSGVLVGDFVARVPAGNALVVYGGAASGRTALLLALAGRVPISTGRLKVDGFALPMRRAAVRSQVAVVRLSNSLDPVAELEGALQRPVALVVLDDLDSVFLPDARSDMATLLSRARRKAADRDATLTVVVSCAEPTVVGEVLPEGMDIQMFDLSPQRSAVLEQAAT